MRGDDSTFGRLMALAQQGDRQAYSALLGECSAWLTRFYARRVVPSQIDDLVQDVLIALHVKRASFDPARPFLPWLAAIARYRWVDHLRKSYRLAEEELEDDVAAATRDDDVIMARVSLERLMAALTPNQAEAITLVKIDGHSVRDAAQRTGQSESAIKVNIHRGLKKMSALIEEAE